MLDSLDPWLPGRRPRVRGQLVRGDMRELCTSPEVGKRGNTRTRGGETREMKKRLPGGASTDEKLAKYLKEDELDMLVDLTSRG